MRHYNSSKNSQSKTKSNKIYIGISGFSYPEWYIKGGFYASIKKQEALAFYATRFNFVEINSSFYREPTTETLKKWKETVPDGFIFALKVHRFFTHMKRLNIDTQFKEKWEVFWMKCLTLESKLGPLLFQLPILKFTVLEKNSMMHRLNELYKILPKNHPIVFECRDKSWDCEEVRKLFKTYNWCFSVIHTNNKTGWAGDIESGFFPTMKELWATASWGIYVRFHGSIGQYKGKYNQKILEEIARLLLYYKKQGKISFVAFNNTNEKQALPALSNAFTLKEKVELL